MSDQPQNALKDRKSRAGMSLKEVNLDYKYKQLLNVFGREITHLLQESHLGKLDKDGNTALINLVKIYKEFKELEREYIDTLSIEELEKKVAARTKDTEEE